MQGSRVSVHEIPPADACPDALSASERGQLALLGFGKLRSTEWIRGRMAAREALKSLFGVHADSMSVLSDQGVPFISGESTCSISLSHDGDYVAVGLFPDSSVRIGIDLCLEKHGKRLERIVDRLDVRSEGLAAVALWSCLESVLKMRRWGISSLLSSRISVTSCPGCGMVCGLGEPATVLLEETPEYTLAYCTE